MAGRLVLQWAAWTKQVELHGQSVRIGRAEDNDIVIPAHFLAPHHAVLEADGNQYRIRDLSEGHGLLAGGQFVPSQTLETGATVRIGDGESNLIQLTYYAGDGVAPDRVAGEEIIPPQLAVPATGLFAPLPTDRAEVVIGRDPATERSGYALVLEHPAVARRHAVLKRQLDGAHEGWTIQDLGSRAGTYVNGRRLVDQALLRDGDILQIGPFSARYHQGRFEAVDQRGSRALRIDVVGAEYRTPQSHRLLPGGKGAGRVLLSNVNLAMLPGEFVAIVGGTGAGKSTLMRLMTGFYAPSKGSVLYDGMDLETYRAAFPDVVGYVPQDDIVHQELTVHDALMFAGRLRLPELSRQQLEARIDEVLETLDLSAQRGQLVKTLSGGQRKRVSIALELLPQPRLLFLDEPTSALDPGMDKRMMFLLRRLADRGHTIILVTHKDAQLELCDQVIFMGVGGHITFFGPPNLVTRFFGQADLPDVFDSIDSVEVAVQWEQRFKDSALYQQYVVSRRRTMPAPMNASMPPAASAQPQSRLVRQGMILARRQLALLLNDRASLAILLLQAPILALLIALVAGPSPWQIAPGVADCAPGRICALHAQRLVFVMACAVIWLGVLNSVRELVKERAIAIRERMVGVRPAAYLGSKLLVLTVLSVVQVLSLLVVISALKGMPTSSLLFPPFAELSLTLVLAALTGVVLGLAVSAASPSSNRAMTFAPFLLLPQILFSGVLFTLGSAQVLSFITASRWTVAALGGTAQVYLDPALRSGGLYPTTALGLVGQWFALLCLLIGGTALAYYLQQRHRQV